MKKRLACALICLSAIAVLLYAVVPPKTKAKGNAEAAGKEDLSTATVPAALAKELALAKVTLAGGLPCGRQGAENLEVTALIYTVLGDPKYQTYVWQSVRQARLVNPCVPILVAMTREGFTSNANGVNQAAQQAAVEYGVAIVDVDGVPKTAESAAFDANWFVMNNLVPLDGNKQFIKWTIGRLFVIHDIAVYLDLRNIWHIENDNTLYSDLGELQRYMEQCQTSVALPVLNDREVVMSLVYWRDVEATRHLMAHLVELYKLGRDKLASTLGSSWVTDMWLVMHYIKTVSVLPSGGRVQRMPSWYIKPQDGEFCLWRASNETLFDAAAIGQFFGGTHDKPDSHFYDESRPFKELKDKKLAWVPCGQPGKQLRCPMIDAHHIVNMHIHSKRLSLWVSDNPTLLS